MTDNVELSKAILAPNGSLQAVDYTGTINLIPRQWGLVQSLGIFGERFGTQKTFMVGKKEDLQGVLMEDRNWETTRPTLARGEQGGVFFKVPHFPLDDMILPSDVDGIIDVNTLTAGTELLSVATVRQNKLERIRASHAKTHEYARTNALVTGDVFAPTGTLKTSYGSTVNVYNEWGITRQSSAIRTGAGVNPQESVNELFGKLQDAAMQGDNLTGYVVICSPELFAALVQNDYIRELYAHAQLIGRQELLVGRLGNSVGLDARYRSFEYAGITFIEYRGSVNGNRFIPAGQGVAFPMMNGLGRLHFAPPNKFDTINGVAQASYVWERMDDRKTKIELESETNFASILERPDLVFTVTNDTTAA